MNGIDDNEFIDLRVTLHSGYSVKSSKRQSVTAYYKCLHAAGPNKDNRSLWWILSGL